jgi:hypothetical protein
MRDHFQNAAAAVAGTACIVMPFAAYLLGWV